MFNSDDNGILMGIPSDNDEHSYGKWQCIVDFPIEKCDFPQLC